VPIIAGSNVVTVRHVEIVGVVCKKKKACFMNSGAVGINRNIISSRIRITGGLGNGGKTWGAFLTLALQDIVEDS